MSTSRASQLAQSEYTEYTVLYTFDVQKRTKVWQDGTMRLFKINHKLLVYSEDKLLVYETFCKHYDAFSEQQELKFDDAWITVDTVVGVYERSVLGLLQQASANDLTVAAAPVARRRSVRPKRAAVSTPLKQRRRVIGLRKSQGSFKSPLKVGIRSPSPSLKHVVRSLPKRTVQFSSTRSSTSPEPSSTLRTPLRDVTLSHNIPLHVNRQVESPSLKLTKRVSTAKRSQLKCVQSRVSNVPTTVPRKTPSKTRAKAQISPISHPTPIQVYDSDSQTTEDISDYDDDDTNPSSLPETRSQLFRRLELGEGKNNREILTETWDNHGRVSRTEAVLELSRRMLRKS